MSESKGPGLIGIDGGIRMVFSAVRYDGKYLLDVDQYASAVPAAASGIPVSYELAPTSSNTAEASVQLTLWTSTVKRYSYVNGAASSFRQSVTTSRDTVHHVTVSDFFNDMSPIVVSSVAYYPSVSLSYRWTPFSDGSTGVSYGTVVPGGDSPFTAMSASDRGVCFSSFSWSSSWYYDADRTIPVAVPPPSLPDFSGLVMLEVVYSDGTDMVKDGDIVSSGVASFSSIPRGDAAPLVEICYVKPDSSVLMSTVKFKQDGMPDQVENQSSIYIVPAV